MRNRKLVFFGCIMLAAMFTFIGYCARVFAGGAQTPVLQTSSGNVLYDFLAHAPEALWSSGAGVLPFPGNPSDSWGFACYVDNAILEDGSTWQRVLETHPQWISKGWISGAYPMQTVFSNTQITVSIGFLAGAAGTDGVRFDVYFDEYRGVAVGPLRYTIISQSATLDGRLDVVTKDLSFIVGKKGNFVLYVYAGETSNRDWAVWAEARIETKPLADLVITDIWESGGLIHFMVKNVGDGATTPLGMPTKSFWNSLLLDGKQVAKQSIAQVLQPGQEIEGVFDYIWQPTLEEHTVKVCADCDQNIEESNEENNCLEEKWLMEKLPDLVVVEVKCDRNDSLIGYVLKNIGDGVAKANHETTLYVEGKEIAHDHVGIDLKPGETFESWFKTYEWPEYQNITVKVYADKLNQVKESNENNNYLEKTCVSFPFPILITSGPYVVDITQDSVTVKWATNKKSDSAIIYSDRSFGGEKTVFDANLVKDHALKITGLKPSSTYRFCVKSKDSCGNVLVSNTMVFETLSLSDNENPSVSLRLQESLIGIVSISATANDNVGVEGVIFSIDGVVKFTDFSPPYIWVCNTTLFLNGVHNFEVTAFDNAGNRAVDAKSGAIANPMPDTNPPEVRIVKPSNGWVRDLEQVVALIQDKEYHAIPAGYIQRAELYIDGQLVNGWTYAPFHFNPLTGEAITVPSTSSLNFTYLWNTTGLEPNSEHTIEVKAWDNSGNYGRDSLRVKKFSTMPLSDYLEKVATETIKIVNIEVTRDVVRHENWFEVSLKIKNTGNVVLEHFVIRDPCIGFQAIALPMPETSRDTSVSYDRLSHRSIVRINPQMDRLNPGESWAFSYYAVPIVFDVMRKISDSDNFVSYPHIIGGFETSISFQFEGSSYHKIFRLPRNPSIEDWNGNGVPELEDAFNAVNYLIITSPRKLFAHNPCDRDGVNLLLQEIGVLAKIKHGVLGYVDEALEPRLLKCLLDPNIDTEDLPIYYGPEGTFRYDGLVRRMPAFSNHSDAYLLIVGETEIIPAEDVRGVRGGGDRWYWDVVFCSDNYYADVWGDDGRPELIVGRIVGDNVRELFKPINASISVYLGLKEFNYHNVLTVTGFEWNENFVKDAETVNRMLEGQGFSVDEVHTDAYDITESFLREALIKFRGMSEQYVNGLSLTQLRNLISVEDAELLEETRRDGLHLDYENTLWNYNSYAAQYVQAQRAIAIKRTASNKGLIFWYGHGSAGGGSWACVLEAKNGTAASIEVQKYLDYGGSPQLYYIPIDFGRSCPVIFAWSCETGRYVDKRYNPATYDIATFPLYGMPEAFFRHGAAVYIGSTMTMGGSPTEASFIFFSHLKYYLDNGRTIGLLFKDMKNAKITSEGNWDVEFAFEVNYYGDPKYGGQP
ncbi:MAG: CARDB domain-containing protein [Candidatus Bathyarchaeia archaeon]